MTKGTTIRMWRRSIVVLVILVVFGFAMLIYRLINLQILQKDYLQRLALEQQLANTKINAQRGTIYDRNMKVLAQSATVWSVALEPAYLNSENKRELVSKNLSEILNLDRETIMKLSKKKSYHVIIKRKIEDELKDKVLEFKKNNNISDGIKLIEDYKRYYPYGSFLSVVMGFVGNDPKGLGGLEARYDKTLSGEQGRILTARNARLTDMPYDYEQRIPAKNGNNLVLCIDKNIQHIVEKNLEEGIKNNKVLNRATAIAIEVNTGEILAMAVKGDFDPNEPFSMTEKSDIEHFNNLLNEEEKNKFKNQVLQKQWRNKAISDTYYPGSVFKMFVAAMAFELNVVDENTPFFCNGRTKPYDSAPFIKCHKTSGHGSQTFVKALCNSCNPAFIMTGQKIGAEKFFEFYKSFGFHEKTGIDLPGETGDLFFHEDGSMTQMELAVASMGQNFGITPIQMIKGMAAIANGGNLVSPHIVKEITDQYGNIVQTFNTKIKKAVISKTNSRRVMNMLQENAISGAAKSAYVPGYRIAGKTGTSQKIGLSRKGHKDYISSFGGIAPADNPKIALLVFFDTPEGDFYYGSAVAAPVFAKIMQETLPYLGIERKFTQEEIEKFGAETPNLKDKKVSDAKNLITKNNLKFLIIGNGDTVLSQMPEPKNLIPKQGTIVLYTENLDKNNNKTKVPNFVGITPAQANKLASDCKLNLKILTNDPESNLLISVAQSIPEKTEVSFGTVVNVNFIAKKN
ncbi:MAG: stage V sporulation protein D [Candidatus Paraimprobicoccus trichonymphae]|uniref:Stage V sporulation protein D n=1 Tax=Candidatus Paraimprobicoccus trichonymphae TaxID=3033793 RepID=A0AA48KYZ5_9FIRM|nr:MAG: stage V sporulation protein D [Candidatus Paraimprobicoccus trichonymphae]